MKKQSKKLSAKQAWLVIAEEFEKLSGRYPKKTDVNQFGLCHAIEALYEDKRILRRTANLMARRLEKSLHHTGYNTTCHLFPTKGLQGSNVYGSKRAAIARKFAATTGVIEI